MRDLRGRVAVVTGAASGIGRATSVLLAAKGAQLALADVDQAGLRETGRLVERERVKVSLHEVDVADRRRMAALPNEILAEHGHVHVLVNNAGVALSSEIVNHDLDDFEWLVGINFWGVVYGCRFFLPHLLKEPEAHVVNISSVFGLIGLPTQSAYCATKFAVRGFTESLRAEMIDTNVGVTCVHPGGVRTNIVKSARMDDALRQRVQRKIFDKALPPEKAAERIVRGIERGAARVLIAPETYFVDGAKRMFPVLTDAIMARGRKRAGV